VIRAHHPDPDDADADGHRRPRSAASQSAIREVHVGGM